MDTVSAIRAALYRGDRATAERLATENKPDVFEAAALGDVVRLEICLGEEPASAQAWSDDGFTALHFAAFLGGHDAVRVLVEAGSDVGAVARNEMKVQPLHSAAANGDVSRVASCSRRAPIQTRGNSATSRQWTKPCRRTTSR
jgi:hypothetical protein